MLGSNAYGQLGDGSYTNRLTPTQTEEFGTGLKATAISAGHGHTCALLDDGSVSCWGYNYHGAVGDGLGGNHDNNRNTPTQTASLGIGRTAVSISGSHTHTCAILDDGSVSCWGYGGNGQLGDASNSNNLVPSLINSLGTGRTAVAISAGTLHTTILDNGSVSCWGRNDAGNLGDGSTTNSNVPIQTSNIGTGRTAVGIGTGYFHTCALLDNGSVSCWGGNAEVAPNYGEIGDGANINRLTPTQTNEFGNGITAISIDL